MRERRRGPTHDRDRISKAQSQLTLNGTLRLPRGAAEAPATGRVALNELLAEVNDVTGEARGAETDLRRGQLWALLKQHARAARGDLARVVRREPLVAEAWAQVAKLRGAATRVVLEQVVLPACRE